MGLNTSNCDPDGFLAIGVVTGREDQVIVSLDLVQVILGGTLHGAEYNHVMVALSGWAGP